MNISPAVLTAQYRRAAAEWPNLANIEHAYGLPRMMLFAVGSRETNLTNEHGDGGHGHGVWQLDDRSHVIPPGFDGNVHLQATTAAKMLAGLLRGFSNVKDPAARIRAALVGYNAGSGTARFNLDHALDLDKGTAHGDYSADTYARMLFLRQEHPAAPPLAARTLTTADLDLIAAAVVRELLSTHASSYDGKSGGSVGHLLGGSFELASAIAHKIGAQP